MSMLSDEEFVKIWQSSETRQEVAEKCGITGPACSARAVKLRALGVKLKSFPRGRKKGQRMNGTPDVSALNALIEGLSNASHEP